MDLSFSGAGFMGCYYFGVVNCWDKYIPRERVRRVAGASAGSLIAAYYLMDLPLHTCLKEIIEMSEDARSRPLGVFDRSNQIVDVLPRSLDKLFPEDAHKRVNGRLYVCMTRLKDLKCVVVNEFETRKDLIDALNCSCFIPVWSGNHVSTYKGVKYIDGGFTNNMPVFDEHTVRVSCFSGASDIAPYDRARMKMMKASIQGMSVNVSWKNIRRGGRALWPPPAHFIALLLQRGFNDTKEFILNNDLIQCDRCFKATERELQPIYSRRTPTISPAASPSVTRAGSLLNLADLQQVGSFKLRQRSKRTNNDSKRRSKKTAKDLAATTTKHDDKENWQPPNLPPVRIKEHRRQSAVGCEFETNRNKSGKQIGRDALERLRLDAEKNQLKEEQQKSSSRVGFASKLREKLHQVAANKSPKRVNNEHVIKEQQMAMPKIVVDEPQIVASDDQQLAAIRGATQKNHVVEPEKLMTVLDIMKAHEDGKDSEISKKLKLRTTSLSSSMSNDSAVGLEEPATPTNIMSGSPAEKYLAGTRPRAQSISLASGNAGCNLLAAQQQQPADRFSSAPSPLPSCPPSPNLNRHCTECIRLRQRARMDDLDESIKQAAEMYSSVKSKEPEREFTSLKWKLTCWLRQFGTPKYSYSFKDELSQETAVNVQADQDDVELAPVEDVGETMAERKAKRKASHPLAWPSTQQQNELPASS